MVNEHLTEEARAALANAGGNGRAPYITKLPLDQPPCRPLDISIDCIVDELRGRIDAIEDLIKRLELMRGT